MGDYGGTHCGNVKVKLVEVNVVPQALRTQLIDQRINSAVECLDKANAQWEINGSL